MPFTPFNLGPGITLKRMAGRRMSLACFTCARILSGLEPGVGMLRGASVLHGYSHILTGALVITLICVVIKGLPERALGVRISAHSALTGALAGTLNHLLLDGIVQHDIRPWWPLTDANRMQGTLSWEGTEAMCVLLALPAIAWLPEGWRRLRATPWR